MPPRILVVEDDPEMKILTEAILLQNGFVVKSVETACEARSAMRQSFFDLVIMDLLLPDGNGLDLCVELKTKNFMSYLPILLVSSVDDKPVIRQSVKIGADGFLIKPLEARTLLTKVQEILKSALKVP